jgi:HPt (histidine-containing phosphotransfer) domain-containing protein
VRVTDQSRVLDWQQLRDITLDDDELMREVLNTLLDDTSKQLILLESAIRDRDQQKTLRLAHYCKGACANVGANAAAAVLKRLEEQAKGHLYSDCADSLCNLTQELDRLLVEAVNV